MVKTVMLEDHIHKLIIDKQKELKDKYRVEVKISDIVKTLIVDNIQKYDLKQAN